MPAGARVPDLFIVGAAKSGTTSLYFWLKGHPEIYMSAVKEPNYFAPDLAMADRHTLRHPDDLDEYLGLFAAADDAKRAGEASVRYLYSQVAPSAIAELQPDARIVVALRNPVEMAFSLYLHRRAHASEPLPTFAEAVDADADRQAGRRIPASGNPHLATYLDRAAYGEQLPRWLDQFGPDRVHVIIFEDLVADPATCFRRLLEFAEVDPAYRPDEFRAYNPAHGGRGGQFRRFAGRLWGPLASVLGEARTRSIGVRVRRSGIFRQKMDRPSLDPALRIQLEGYFAADVARTSELVGRDLATLWFPPQQQPAAVSGAGATPQAAGR